MLTFKSGLNLKKNGLGGWIFFLSKRFLLSNGLDHRLLTNVGVVLGDVEGGVVGVMVPVGVDDATELVLSSNENALRAAYLSPSADTARLDREN